MAMQEKVQQILRPREVAERLGLSVTTVWRLRKRGELPPPIRVSPGAVGWRADEIDAWLGARERAS
jgi:prophage regulatory protein